MTRYDKRQQLHCRHSMPYGMPSCRLSQTTIASEQTARIKAQAEAAHLRIALADTFAALQARYAKPDYLLMCFHAACRP